MNEYLVLDEFHACYCVYRVIEGVVANSHYFSTRDEAEAYIKENE